MIRTKINTHIGLVNIATIALLLIVLYNVFIVWRVYTTGLPHIEVGGVELTVKNMDNPLVAEKLKGVWATSLILLLLNILAIIAMRKHKLFHYILLTAPSLLGFLTSIFYTPSIYDKAIAIGCITAYVIGAVATVKRTL